MKSFIARHLALMTVLVFSFFVSASAKSPDSEEISQRVKNLNTVIQVKTTEKVIQEALLRVSKYRMDSETILGRTSLYFPMIEYQLRERNMPDELKYLAVIESSLNPTLESRKGAAGMWQIMERTANILGLKVDKYIDERMNVEKSTSAALDYLLILFNMYDDWTMALAAYNCGEGNVNKAIRKSGGKTKYWEIHKYLPKETQNFIPRYLGVAYLMNYYYLHDLTPKEPSDELKYSLTIKVFDKVDFKNLSNELSLDINVIKYLNPMYRKGLIPESKDLNYYTLTLPDLAMAVYIENNNSIDNIINNPFVLTRNNWRENDILASGEGFNMSFLKSIDLISSKDSFKTQLLEKIEERLKVNTGPVTLYRLRRKESLSDVAAKYNISLDELMSINNISISEGINPGSIIILPGKKA